MQHQTNSAYRFSLYRNLTYFNQPDVAIDINQLYEIIKEGYLEKEIITLRKVCSNEEICDKILRGHIPAVTLSGIFGARNVSGLIKHSGLIHMELPVTEHHETFFSEMCKDVYTYLAYRNPLGNGLKVVVKIRESAETHLDQFLALETYYKTKFGIEPVPDSKEVSHTMLLSHDPGIYCNPDAKVFHEVFEAQKPEMKLSYKAEENKLKIHFADKTRELQADQLKMPAVHRRPKIRFMQ